MAGYRRSVVIDRPVREVYAYLVDLERVAQWSPGVVDSAVITEGPLGVGTRFWQRRRIRGVVQRHEIEVVEVVPDRRHTVALTTAGITMRFSFDLEPIGDGATRVRYTASFSGPPLVRPVLPVVAHTLERVEDDLLGAFKRAVEAVVSDDDYS